jgi:hypothetical protein
MFEVMRACATTGYEGHYFSHFLLLLFILLVNSRYSFYSYLFFLLFYVYSLHPPNTLSERLVQFEDARYLTLNSSPFLLLSYTHCHSK